MYLYILPNHLSTNVLKYIKTNHNEIKKIYLVEHPKWFLRFNFHKMKLAFQRATMKSFYNEIQKIITGKTKLKYIDAASIGKTGNFVKDRVQDFQSFIFDPCDKDILEYCSRKKICIIPCDYFMLSLDDHMEFIELKKNKNLVFNSFYIFFRKKLNILMTSQCKPIGGKYSYDVKNRKKIPSEGIKNLKDPIAKETKFSLIYKQEAIGYVEKYFPNCPGSCDLDNFIYPIDQRSSENWFKKFIKDKLDDFGPYQDAMDTRYIFGYHSVSSMLINSGLLSPEWCITQIISENKRFIVNKRLFSVEGIIRQYFWREYMYFTYIHIYKDFHNIKQMDDLPSVYNFWNHKRKLNKQWYNGTTGLFPVDYTIELFNIYGYVDHIKRLMIMLNIMTICEIHPFEIFKWFSEMNIDSASCDWVMCGNVFGFSYSDGGLITTRPYFSSSNYILKMSNFGKTPENDSFIQNFYDDFEPNPIVDNTLNTPWDEVWKALYYRFVNRNSKVLKKNYSTSRYVNHWSRKKKKEKDSLLKLASDYLKLI